MSEPRDTRKDGGETASAPPAPEPEHGLTDDVRSGMLGEGESPDHGGMADEG